MSILYDAKICTTVKLISEWAKDHQNSLIIEAINEMVMDAVSSINRDTNYTITPLSSKIIKLIHLFSGEAPHDIHNLRTTIACEIIYNNRELPYMIAVMTNHDNTMIYIALASTTLKPIAMQSLHETSEPILINWQDGNVKAIRKEIIKLLSKVETRKISISEKIYMRCLKPIIDAIRRTVVDLIFR